MKTSRLFTAIGLTAVLGLAACNRYYDDMQLMGERVEVLEQQTLELNTQLAALNEVIAAIEQQGYVTSVVQHADGTTTVSFSTGKTFTLRPGRRGTDGADGTDIAMLLGARQDENDGLWYWTMNDEWLLDSNGQRLRAGACDGHDGADGRSAAETGAVVPQVRINTTTRHWEISADGGNTWEDTGISADGHDGRDGRDGNNGQDELIMAINVAADGKSITFVLRDGRTFTVPIQYQDP